MRSPETSSTSTALAEGCRHPRDVPGDPYESLLGSYRGKCDGCDRTWKGGDQMHCRECHATFGPNAIHCHDCHAVFGSEPAHMAHLHGRNHALALNARGQWSVATALEAARRR